MLVLLTVIATAVSTIAATLLVQALRRHDNQRHRRWLANVEVEPVVLELTDQRTIAGQLVETYPHAVRLRSARLLGDGRQGVVPFGGELVIPRDRIAWCQRGVPLDDVRPGREITREVA